jgi:3-dehydroquinate synthase
MKLWTKSLRWQDDHKTMQTLKVKLGDRSYPICVGNGILSSAGNMLKEIGMSGKVAIVTNPVVAQLYLDTVHDALCHAGFEVTPILIPDGEHHKTLATLAVIFDSLVGKRFERRSCVLALGGGVVGDLAGFAAATYLRGIQFVQIPTTLLAQVDSSVGGKTGVNHGDGKNLIGAFYQPRTVIIDASVLLSLPRRELVAGLAEVVKYAIIEDPGLFTLLEAKIDKMLRLDLSVLSEVIATCCSIKASIVEQDEREDDSRAVLNFGHTIGHALESATHYRKFLHGEAVGIGMAQAAIISFQQGFCDAATVDRIKKLIKVAGLPTEIPADLSVQSLIQSMQVDKKIAGGKIRFVMTAGLGKTRFHSITPEQVAATLGA